MATDNKTIILVGVVVAVIAIAAAALLVSNNNNSGNNDGYVVYDGNGGEYDGQKSIKSTTLTVLPNMFVNGDKDFTGWNTKQNGTGTTYQVDDEITLGIKLYAQWAEPSTDCQVTFRQNEYSDYFSITANGQKIDEGGKLTVPDTGFTIELTAKNNAKMINFREYILDIYRSADFKACMFSVNCVNPNVKISEFTVDGNKATAQVTGVQKGTYMLFSYDNSQERNYIAYSGNGGTTDSGSGAIRSTDSYKAPTQAESFKNPPQGKTTLVSWNTAKDGSGTSFQIGSDVPIGFLLYAIWE